MWRLFSGGSRILAPVVVALCAGTTLSALGAWVFHNWQQQSFQSRVATAAQNRFNAIESEIERALSLVERGAGLVTGREPLPESEFARIATALIGSEANRHSLEWLPRIPHSGRAKLEAELQRPITEIAPGQTPAPARERPEYYPIRFVSPVAHSFLLGADGASFPQVRAAMQASLRSGRVTAAPPFSEWLGGDGQFRILALARVKEVGREVPQGYFAGAFLVSDLVEQAMARLTPFGMRISVFDITGGRVTLLHTHQSRIFRETKSPTATAVSRTIPFADRVWEVRCEPVVPRPPAWIPLSLLGVGLLVTCMVAALLQSYVSRAHQVAAIVQQRTAELVAEIRVRRSAEAELAVARDRALELARIKSEFLANVSHELRTPLNGIIGATAMLLADEDRAERRESLEIARESSHALLSMIEDLLDLSRLEASKLRLETQPFDPEQLVESALEVIAVRARARSLDLAGWVESDGPVTVLGDPARIRQVLLNLLSNAVKFTESGWISLRVLPSGTIWRFEITDTGIGIASEAQDRLFQRFEQVDGTSARRFGGTGLGLAISRGLVQLMGGAIGVRSEPGAGSLFWFEIPLPLATPGASPAVPAVGPETVPLPPQVTVVGPPATTAAISWWLASEGVEVRRSLGVAANAPVLIAPADAPGLRECRGSIITLRPLGQKAEPIPGVSASLPLPVRRQQLLDALRQTRQRVVRTEAPVPMGTAGRVLLAEDNAVNRRVALWMLERLGYRADCVVNGKEAVEACRTNSYDAILMDCQMPEMDGYRATALVRGMENGAARTPIIALTAHAMSGDRERCLEAGMDDYLSKPVALEALREKLGRWAGQSNRIVSVTQSSVWDSKD